MYFVIETRALIFRWHQYVQARLRVIYFAFRLLKSRAQLGKSVTSFKISSFSCHKISIINDPQLRMLWDDKLYHDDLDVAMLNLHLACFCFDVSNHIKFI